ncbi:MAG: hypothetical protein IPJ30_24710 [Acidobacteria bacterium]|nr:hypothetical protein [Acidobacteriota bacterium]
MATFRNCLGQQARLGRLEREVADLGEDLQFRTREIPDYGCQWVLVDPLGCSNKYPPMPTFKQGFSAEPFENVQVYNLMCESPGLKPAETMAI